MAKKEKQNLVEIVRSFSFKVNLGNYQVVDVFCSQKAEVPQDKAEETSEALFLFCKQEVIKSINNYLNKDNKEFISKIKEWLASGGDKNSTYGKETKQEIYNQTSKIIEASAEIKAEEKLPIIEEEKL